MKPKAGAVGAAAKRKRSVRNPIVALILIAALAFGVVVTAAVVLAGRIARTEELSTAARMARTVSRSVFAPRLPAAMRGDPAAIEALDAAARQRRSDDGWVRVKVWSADGRIVYSDDAVLIGRTFPLTRGVHAAFEGLTGRAELSAAAEAENEEERGLGRLVEVYVPLLLDNRQRVAFEIYTTDQRLRASESRLRTELVTLTVGSLGVLVLLQLPVVSLLVRRLGSAQRERSRLLSGSLAASSRERARVARDLHDGVLQDLAGTAYALGAARRASTPGAYRLLDLSSAALERAIQSLRTLVVDISPPDLTAQGLTTALGDLTARLRSTGSVEVSLEVSLTEQLSPDVAATVYRAARECLLNVEAHACATEVDVTITQRDGLVLLAVTDNGLGMPTTAANGPANGHVGLALLADAARDLGGALTTAPGNDSGTTVQLILPAQANGAS